MIRHLLLVALVVILIRGGLSDPSYTAQAQTEMPRATSPEGQHDKLCPHPIIGSWRWDEDPAHPGAQTVSGVFRPDGTYEGETQSGVPVVGVWQATGPRTVAVTYVYQDLLGDPEVAEPNMTVVWITADVKASGNVASAVLASETRALDGTVLDQDGLRRIQGARGVLRFPSIDQALDAADPQPPAAAQEGRMVARDGDRNAAILTCPGHCPSSPLGAYPATWIGAHTSALEEDATTGTVWNSWLGQEFTSASSQSRHAGRCTP